MFLTITPEPDPEPEPEAHELTTIPTTTEEPYLGPGCFLDGKHYKEGAQITGHHQKPCEICYCIRNTSACVMQECALQVDGCTPIYRAGACCPSRYNCSAEAATTVPPELRHPFVPSEGCHANGRTYIDGEAVPSSDPCEHCYSATTRTVPPVNVVTGNDFTTQIYEQSTMMKTIPPHNSQSHTVASQTVKIQQTATVLAEPSTIARKDDSLPMSKEEADNDLMKPSFYVNVTDLRPESEKMTTITPNFTTTFGRKPIFSNDSLEPRKEANGFHISDNSTTLAEKYAFSISTRKTTTIRRPVPTPGSIPGEGVCRHGNKIYQNGDEVKSSNPCVEFCMCINSIVYCDEIICEEEKIVPQEGIKCEKVHFKDECCPQYECYHLEELTSPKPSLMNQTTITTSKAGENKTSITTSTVADLSTETNRTDGKEVTTQIPKLEEKQKSTTEKEETSSPITSTVADLSTETNRTDGKEVTTQMPKLEEKQKSTTEKEETSSPITSTVADLSTETNRTDGKEVTTQMPKLEEKQKSTTEKEETSSPITSTVADLSTETNRTDGKEVTTQMPKLEEKQKSTTEKEETSSPITSTVADLSRETNRTDGKEVTTQMPKLEEKQKSTTQKEETSPPSTKFETTNPTTSDEKITTTSETSISVKTEKPKPTIIITTEKSTDSEVGSQTTTRKAEEKVFTLPSTDIKISESTDAPLEKTTFTSSENQSTTIEETRSTLNVVKVEQIDITTKKPDLIKQKTTTLGGEQTTEREETE
ncbi:mucin-3A-like protein, partial [Dinothrombium tinctorium]